MHARTQADADLSANIDTQPDATQQPTVRSLPTDSGHAPLIAHDALERGAKVKTNTLHRDGGLTSCLPCFRSHRRPLQNCARARKHVRTQAEDADVKHEWWRQRVRPTHQLRRPHNVSARDDIQPSAKQTSTRFAVI